MREIASFLTRIPHWLFLLIFAALLAPALLYYSDSPLATRDPNLLATWFTKTMSAFLPAGFLFYGWIWAIGKAANQSLAPANRRPDRIFDLAMFSVLCYLPFGFWAFPRAVLEVPNFPIPKGFVILLHFTATVSLFYAAFFSARSVATIGQHVRAGFWRTILFFLAILYFPIGVWFIQPRINAIQSSAHAGS